MKALAIIQWGVAWTMADAATDFMVSADRDDRSFGRVASAERRHYFARETMKRALQWIRGCALLTGVGHLREILADELDCAEDYDFFSMDYEEGESPDVALMRLFEDERMSQLENDRYIDDHFVALVLCHG